MNRKLLLICATAAAIGAVSSVQAADMPLKAPPPPPPPPPFSWTGFYIGGNIGGISSHLRITDNLTGVSLNTGGTTGLMLGGQLGYNWQVGAFVFGGEFDGDWTDLKRTSPAVATGIGTLQAQASTPSVVSLAARFGFAADRFLIYSKLGGGWVNNKLTVANLTTGLAATATNSNSGLLWGLGAEYAIVQNWTIKFEYDHVSLGTSTTASPVVGDRITVTRALNMFKGGFNYKF